MTFPLTQEPSSSSSSSLIYQVAVDAFCFAPHDTINQYFLTHFHADHYGGISKKWAYERVFGNDEDAFNNQTFDFDDDSIYKKIIYCTGITGDY